MKTEVAVEKKFDPRCLKTSSKMTALLGYLVGATWTAPAIAGLIVTSDGFVLAVYEGDVGYNHIIGTEEDLRRNVAGAAKAAGLSEDEEKWLAQVYEKKVCHV